MLRSSDAFFDGSVETTPIVEQRYSIHAVDKNPLENTIKHTLDLANGTSVRSYLQTKAFNLPLYRSEIIFARCCPQLQRKEFDFKDRAKDREVTTKQNPETLQTLLYVVAISKAGKRAFAESSMFRVATETFSTFAVHMAYCFSNHPAENGYMKHCRSSAPIINGVIQGDYREVLAGYSIRQARDWAEAQFWEFHSNLVGDTYRFDVQSGQPRMLDDTSLAICEKVGPSLLTYEQSRERFREIGRRLKGVFPLEYHPRNLALDPDF